MDGKGCWMDNVFIERLWRSLKYECVYIQEFDTVIALKRAISNWFEFYVPLWDRVNTLAFRQTL
jgi:putative transposase